MLTVYDYLDIRAAHARGESVRAIARRLRHSQKTIRKVIASPDGRPTPYTRSVVSTLVKLGPFTSIVDQILKDDESAPPKQRHTAAQVYRRLVQERQYTGSYSAVRRYLQKKRRSDRETFIPLDHQPGCRIECDFGQVAVDYPDGRQVVSVLTVVWSFSNCPFMVALPTQRTEAVLHGMTLAFDYFGCVPREVWWDNPRTVAIEILRGRQRTLNSHYAALASHYRFQPLFCLPRKGQEKSDVERTVYALERRACTPVPQVRDIDELNGHLLRFCQAELDRTVTGQTDSIGRRFEREKQLALALPVHRFDACIVRQGQSDKYQTVLFETNRYSVPRTSAFRSLSIKACIDQVRIVQDGQTVATHRRSYGRHESILDPMHYLPTLSRKPGCLDHSSLFRDWQLPPAFTRLRDTLEQTHGQQTGSRHYIRVLQLLMNHPVQRIARAIEQCRNRRTITAELIGEATRGLAATDDTIEPFDELPIDRRVQVPRPDLRRFDTLLSSHTSQGDPIHARSTTNASQAQPQGAALADDAGGICQAVA